MRIGLFIFLLSMGVSNAQTNVLEVGQRPESAIVGFNNLYYISVMGGQEQGDGKIVVLENNKVRDFANGLNEPKGLAFSGKYLIVTDEKKVWKIDSKGEKSLLADESSFPVPVRFLNDAVMARDQKAVYISDMGARDKIMGPDGQLWPLDSEGAKSLPAIGRVFRIGLDGKVTIAVDSSSEIPTPNGIWVKDNNRLLVADFFTGSIYEIANGKRFLLARGYRGADGIEVDSKGNIYLSSWTQGKVWKLDSKGGNPKVIVSKPRSTADLHLDRKKRVLLVPIMLENKLEFYSL
jgi:sugar lactone lactonase YvrE